MFRSRPIAITLALSFPAAAQVRFGAPDDFAPEINGPVHALFVQDDGMVVIAGDFTEVNGTPRNRLARIAPDGQLDPAFAAGSGADGTVRHLHFRPRSDRSFPPLEAAYYLAGEFSEVDGHPAPRVARIRADDGAHDPGFDLGTGPDGAVHCLATHDDRDLLYLGGGFQSIDGRPVPHLAMIRESGDPFHGIDLSAVAPDGPVRAMAFTSYWLTTGGNFTAIGGQPRPYHAVFDTLAGRLEPLGGPAAFNGPVTGLARYIPGAVSPSVIATGDFTQVGDQPASGLVKINPVTGYESFVPGNPLLSVSGGAASTVRTYRGSDGWEQLLLAGSFTHAQGSPRAGLAIIPIGQFWDDSDPRPHFAPLDPDFDPGAGVAGTIHAVMPGSGERLYVGGEFTSLDGVPRQNLARLHGRWLGRVPSAPRDFTATAADGETVALSWRWSWDQERYLIERRRDGEPDWSQAATVRLRSSFVDRGLEPGQNYEYRVRGENYNGLGDPSEVATATTTTEVWNGAGRLDRPFVNALTNTARGRAFAELPDGRLLFAGDFRNHPGAQSDQLLMLLPDETPDPAFEPGDGPTGAIAQILAQPDGRIILGGAFTAFDGTPALGICRLNADGSLDPSFRSPFPAGAHTEIHDLLLLPDGRIVAAGDFRIHTPFPLRNLALLHPDGNADQEFTGDPDMEGPVFNLAAAGRDSFLVGGWGDYRLYRIQYFLRIRLDGSIDPRWPAESDELRGIFDAASDASGRIYVAGQFLDRSDFTFSSVARLLADGSLDPSFSAPRTDSFDSTNYSYKIAVSHDGRPIVFGSPTGSETPPGAYRLNLDGSLNGSFLSPAVMGEPPRQSEPGGPFKLHVDSRNRLVVAGFEPPGEMRFNRSGFVRLSAGAPDTLDAPNNLSAASTSTTLALSWTPAAGAFATTVERSDDGGASWQIVANLAAPIDRYQDSEVAPGHSYQYRLRARALDTLSAPAELAAATWTPFQQWKHDHGFAFDEPALTVPPSGHAPLLLTYALALDPLAIPSHVLQFHRSGDRFFALYPRPRDDAVYEVRQSPDGIAWTSEGVDQGPPGLVGFASVSTRLSRATFLRLEVRERSTP